MPAGVTNVQYLASDAPTIRLSEIAGSYCRRPSGSIVPLRSRALVNVAGVGIMRGHTIDIAEDRITLTIPSKLQLDQHCSVFFALIIADHTVAISGSGRVISCTGSDASGYCVDLTFSVEDKKSRIAIEQLFSAKPSNRIQ